MTREEFNNLDIMEQIEFINSELSTHKTITKVCKVNDLRRQTIADNFKKYGYQFNDNEKQYTKDSNVATIATSVVKTNIKPIETIKKTTNTNTKDNKYKTLETEIEGLKWQIKDILDQLEKINNTTMATSVATPATSAIDNIDNKETTPRHFRIYTDISKDLTDFMNKNKQYKTQDIISSAIKEYLDKYNK